MFDVLASCAGRVVGRAELIRRAGLTGLGPRRCDALISGIRDRIGSERLLTVRRRGWMLVPDTTTTMTDSPARPPERT